MRPPCDRGLLVRYLWRVLCRNTETGFEYLIYDGERPTLRDARAFLKTERDENERLGSPWRYIIRRGWVVEGEQVY